MTFSHDTNQPLPKLLIRPPCSQQEDELDPRLFAHIHLDHRLTGSHLQGDSFIRTTNYVLSLLKYITSTECGISNEVKNQIQETINQVKDQFQNLCDVQVVIDKAVKVMREDLNKLVEDDEESISIKKVKKSYIEPIAAFVIDKLKKERTIIFPGGWVGVDNASGHAMCYQMNEEEDGSYTFLVFNTGAGIENHLKLAEAKDKYLPVMAYRIPKTTSTDDLQSLITELISPDILPRCNSAKISDANWHMERKYNENRIYHEIIPKAYLIGAEPINPELFTRMYTQSQLAGTCAMRALMPLLHAITTGEAYQQLFYQLNLQSIIDHYKIQNAKNNLQDPIVQRQLTHSITSHSRMTKKLMERTKNNVPVLSDAFAKEVLEGLEFINNEVVKAKTLSKPHSINNKYKVAERYDDRHDLDPKRKKYFIRNPTTSNTTEVKEEKLEKQIPPTIKDYQNPHDYFLTFSTILINNNKIGSSPEILSSIERFFLSFPVDFNEAENYWKSLDPNQAKKTLIAISTILDIYIKHSQMVALYGSPKQVITANTAALQSLFIINRFFNNDSHFLHFSNYLPPLPNDAGTVTFDPVYDKHYQGIANLTQRMRTMSNESKKEYDNDIDDYDLNFLLHYLDKVKLDTLINVRNNPKMSPLENARLNIYESATVILGKRSNDRDELATAYTNYSNQDYINILKEYDICLLFKDFCGSCGRIASDDLQGFPSMDELLTDATARRSQNCLSKSQRHRKVTQDYSTEYIYQHNSTVYNTNGIQNYLPIKNETIRTMVLHPQATNETVISRRNHLATIPDIDGASLSFTRLFNHECRIIATKDLFEYNLGLLNYPEYRTLILLNLFTPELLEKTLHRQPEFANQLIEFIKKGINYHTEGNRLSNGVLLCYELAFLLQRYFKQHPNFSLFKDAFNYLVTLDTKIINHAEHYKSRFPELYNNLLMIYFLKNSISDDEIYSQEKLVLMYKAMMICSLMPSNEFNDPILAYDASYRIEHKKEFLSKQLQNFPEQTQKEILKQILLDVLAPLLPSNYDYNLDLTYPLVSITHPNIETVIVDLTSGKIVSEQARAGVIPKEILANPTYQTLFGKTSRPAIIREERMRFSTSKFCDFTIGSNSFYVIYTTEQGSPPKLIVKARLGDPPKWYMLAPKEFAHARFNDPAILMWSETESFDIEVNPKTHQVRSVTPSYYYTQGLNNFIAKAEYVEHKSPNNEGYYLLHELNSEGKKTGYTLVRRPEILTQFEEAYNIELWQHNDVTTAAIPFKINLPRYGLSWEGHRLQNNEVEYIWNENKDFRLVQSQINPIDFPNSIFMEHRKTGEIICLIPKQEFKPVANNVKDEFYAIEYDIAGIIPKREFANTPQSFNWIETGSQQYYQFKLENKELVGTSAVEYLQLAYIYLATHNPSAAMRALRKCHEYGGLRGSEAEITLIRQIMMAIPNLTHLQKPDEEIKINDPETDAVRLYAAFLLAEQKQLSFNQPSDFSLKSGAEQPTNLNQHYQSQHRTRIKDFYNRDFHIQTKIIYDNYYKRLGNVPLAMQLTNDAELSLLRCLYKGSSPQHIVISNRFRELKQTALIQEIKILQKQEKQQGLLNEKDKLRLEEITNKFKAGNIPQKQSQHLAREKKKVLPKELPKSDLVSILSRDKSLFNNRNNIPYYRRKRLNVISASSINASTSLLDIIYSFGDFYKILVTAKSDDKEYKKIQSLVTSFLKVEFFQSIKNEEQSFVNSLFSLLAYVIQYPDAKWPEIINAQNQSNIFYKAKLLSEEKPIYTDALTINVKTIPSSETFFKLQEIENQNNILLFVDEQKLASSVASQYFPEIVKEVDSLNLSSLKPIFASENLEVKDEDFISAQAQKFKLEIAEGARLNAHTAKINAIYLESLKDEEIQQLSLSIEKDISAENDALDERIKSLLQDANVALLSEKAETRTKVEILGLQKYPIKLENLILLYLQGDKEEFRAKTHLSDPAIELLFQRIHDYLLLATANQQKLRIITTLKEIKAHPDKTTSEYKSLITNLGELLLAKRHYDPHVNPEMLVFEFLDNKLLRVDQCEILQRFSQKVNGNFHNEIAQLIMGAGKSKILLPLLALKRADGTNLSFIEVPPAMFETNLADLSKTTLRLFGKKALPFIFNRDTDCSVTNLKLIYKKLHQAMLNRDYFITTAENIMSLQLKYLELLKQKNTDSNSILQIQHLEKIITLIKERGDVLIDEVDTVLDIKRQLNYTQGDKQAVDANRRKNILKIYSLMQHVELTVNTIKCTLEDVMLGKQTIASEVERNQALAQLASVIVNHPDSPLYAITKSMNESLKLQLLNYILDSEGLDQIPEVVTKLNNFNRNLVDLMKGELEIFKFTLFKKFNEHYGFPKSDDYQGSKEISIPYLGNNVPNERAKYGVYPTINLTIQGQYQRNLPSLQVVNKLIVDLTNAATEEVADRLGEVPIDDTDAGLTFKRYTGRSISSVGRFTNEVLLQLQKEFRQNKQAMQHIVETYILPDVTQYPSVLQMNPINHINQYRSALGFTGTAWNANCYNTRLVFNEEKYLGTDGKTIDLLLKKNPTINVNQTESHDQLIENIVLNHQTPEKVQAIIDVGSLLRGIDNETVAKTISAKLLKRENNQIRSVLYFNNQNQLCALQVESGKTILIGSTLPEIIFAMTGSNPNQYFVYYDQRHTQGIDIKLASSAIATVTLDSDTTTRDIAQGARRARQLDGEQTVEFILSPAAASRLPDPANIKMSEVSELLQENQVSLLSEYHLRAALENMHDVIREDCLSKIYKCDTVSQKIYLYEIFSSIFETNQMINPTEEFGRLLSLQKTADILDQQSNRLKSLWTSFMNQAKIVSSFSEIDTINQTIKTKALKICKSFYKKEGRSSDLVLEMENEKEAERENENEKQRQNDTVSHVGQDYTQASRYKPWRDEFPFDFTTPRDSELEFDYTGVPHDRIKPAGSMFSQHPILAKAISQDISVTDNFSNTASNVGKQPDKFFKPINFLLTMHGKKTNSLKIVLITQDELKEFEAYLDKNKNHIEEEGYEFSIVSPYNTPLVGKPPTHHPNYAYLLEQIRFINGDIDILARSGNLTWLLDNPNQYLSILENAILPNHKEKQIYLNAFKQKLTNLKLNVLQKNAANIEAIHNAIIEVNPTKLQEALTLFKEIEPSADLINHTLISSTLKDTDLSLLDCAIQTKNSLIVNSFLENKEIPLDPISENRFSHIETAITDYAPDIFASVISNPRMLPKPNDAVSWNTLFNLVFKTNQPKIITAFLELAVPRCQCLPFVINNQITALLKPFNPSKMTNYLNYLTSVPAVGNLGWQSFLTLLTNNYQKNTSIVVSLIKFWQKDPNNNFLSNKFLQNNMHALFRNIYLEYNQTNRSDILLALFDVYPQYDDVQTWGNFLQNFKADSQIYPKLMSIYENIIKNPDQDNQKVAVSILRALRNRGARNELQTLIMKTDFKTCPQIMDDLLQTQGIFSDLPLLELLLSKGGKINNFSTLGNITTLCKVIDLRLPCIAAAIINFMNPEMLNTLSTQGESVLDLAVKQDDLATVSLLVGKGAKVQQTTTSEPTLLSAIRNKNFEMTKLLVDNGADINVKNNENKSALDIVESLSMEELKEEKQTSSFKFFVAQPTQKQNTLLSIKELIISKMPNVTLGNG